MTENQNDLDTAYIADVIKRLSDILEEEVSLIENMKLTSLHKNQEEKLKLSSVVEGYRDMIKADPMLVKVLSESSLKEIKEVTAKFEEVVKQEEKQLIRAKKVHHFIMDAVRTVVNKRQASQSLYNKDGYTDNSKKKVLYTQPIALSEMA